MKYSWTSWTFIFVFIVLIFQPSLSYSECAEGIIYSESHNRIVESEIADHVGFCSHHASRDLLHQAICKYAKTADECFQPAVLDFLEIDVDVKKENRDSEFALYEILKRRTISRESCSDFNRFFKHKAISYYRDYGEKFANAVHDVIVNECELQKKLCKGDPTHSLNPLLKDCDLSAKTGHREFLYQAVKRRQEKDKTCEKRPIPALKWKAYQYKANDLQNTIATLNETLKSGNQVRAVTDSPHALVISNYREICIAGKKTLQYQTLDSLYATQWSSAKKAGSWIDGRELVKHFHPQADLEWLEKE